MAVTGCGALLAGVALLEVAGEVEGPPVLALVEGTAVDPAPGELPVLDVAGGADERVVEGAPAFGAGAGVVAPASGSTYCWSPAEVEVPSAIATAGQSISQQSAAAR